MKQLIEKRYKGFLIALLVLSVGVGVGVGWYSKVNAIPLIGGVSTIVRWCNDGAFVIQVVGPRPGQFKVRPGITQIYLYGQFNGTWALGDSTPGGVCCTGKACIPVLGTVTMIGTSMI